MRETRQALTYANESAIAYMAVTDGDTWRMYDVFAIKPIEDRIIMEFSVSLTPTHESALRSLSMWRGNLGSDSGPAPASEPVLSSYVSKPDVAVQGDHENHPVIEDTGWVALDKVEYKPKDARPTRIRLPDQSEVRIRSWSKVWINIAEWVAKNEPRMKECKYGPSKHMVIKSVNEGFWKDRGGYRLSNGLWIEPDVTANTLLNTARSFLNHFNFEPSSVSIRFD